MLKKLHLKLSPTPLINMLHFVTVPQPFAWRRPINFYVLLTPQARMKWNEERKFPPNCFHASFCVRRRKMQQKHFHKRCDRKRNFEPLKEIAKWKRKTFTPRTTMYGTPFSPGSLKCHSSSISNTAWGNTRHKHFSPEKKRKQSKACAHSRINRTLKGINRWANIESLLGSVGSVKLFFLLPCVQLVKRTPFIMKFMTHDCLMELNSCSMPGRSFSSGFSLTFIKTPFVNAAIVGPNRKDRFATCWNMLRQKISVERRETMRCTFRVQNRHFQWLFLPRDRLEDKRLRRAARKLFIHSEMSPEMLCCVRNDSKAFKKPSKLGLNKWDPKHRHDGSVASRLIPRHVISVTRLSNFSFFLIIQIPQQIRNVSKRTETRFRRAFRYF